MKIKKENVKFKTSVIKNGFQCNRCKAKLLHDVVVYGTIKRAEAPGEQDALYYVQNADMLQESI